jgi:hypothetical protein
MFHSSAGTASEAEAVISRLAAGIHPKLALG